MKNLLILALFLSFLGGFSQGRNINKPTLESSYSYVEIHKALRDFVDANQRTDYFNDNFFNDLLKKILKDNQFTSKEKVQIFYLMQKKLGYSFVGVNYLPPKQNYFVFHQSKMVVLQKTKDALQSLNLDPSVYIQIADSHQTNDPVIAANAMLLATLINTTKVQKKLREFSVGEKILKSKNPGIFNHYLCLSVSLVQDTVITNNLKNNLQLFKQEAFLEDVLCALYSKPNALAPIKNYILAEKNQANDLSIQTALCALSDRVSETAFQQSVQGIANAATEPWKKELLTKIVNKQIPFNYSLTSNENLVPKVWDRVQISIFNDGTLISYNTLLEFDPN